MNYVIRFIVGITLLVNVSAFASDPLPFDAKKAPSVESMMGCSIEKCYVDSMVRDQNDPTFLRETGAFYAAAKEKYGNGRIKGAGQKEGVFLFKQLALRGHVASMREMAEVCLAADKFSYKYSEALKWYVLAYQVEYLSNGQSSPETNNGLKRLMQGEKSKKDKDVKYFSADYDFFLKAHEIGQHKTMITLVKLQESYKMGALGKYLSQSDRAIKAEWFWQFFLNHYATSDDLIAEASRCYKKADFASTLRYFIKANTPDSIALAASLYVDGSLRLQNGDFDYVTAEQLCLASKTPSAFYNLGWMYHMNKIGNHEYARSAAYYEASGTPEGLCNLGNLHRDGRVGTKNGRSDYERARELYLQSQHPNALWNLGRLYRDGQLGNRDYNKAAQYFLKASTQESLTDLGTLYSFGRIGLIDGKPDLKTAVEFFQKAKGSVAYFNLGSLCLRGAIFAKDGEPDYLRALTYLGLSSHSHVYDLRLLIIMANRHDFKKYAAYFKTPDPDEAIKFQCKLIVEQMPSWDEATQELYKGHLALYLEKNFEQAIVHYNNALLLGEVVSRLYIDETNKVIKRNRLKERMKEDLKAIAIVSSPIEQSTSDDSSSEDSQAVIAQTPETQPAIQGDSDPLPERAKQYKPLKAALTNAEKIAKTFEKIKSRIRSVIQPVECTSKDDKKILMPLKITFSHPDVKTDFERLEATKIKELMGYIEAKPYATEGTGQPEVLKGKYKGVKGCISRRIDGENRLVYKVTGQREILILSCCGHY